MQNHNAGFGARATIIQIQSKIVRKNIQRLSNSWYYTLRDFVRSFAPDIPTQAQLDSFNKAKLNYGDSIKSYLLQKPMFSLSVATATNIAFDNNSFGSNRISRTGIWANAELSINLNKNGSVSTNYLNVSALIRYINDRDSLAPDNKYIRANLLDYGGKAEFQFGKFSLAYEYVRRTSDIQNVSDTYKSVGLLHYKIKEGLFLTGAFGQNFSSVNNLITTIGINWGLSSGEEKIDSQ